MPAIPLEMELQASLFRGALSLAERPSLAQQSPGLLDNSLPAERTACKHFGSREKERISAEDASGGLCPLDTHKPFFEGLDPKIHVFHTAALSVFWKTLRLFFVTCPIDELLSS